MTSNSTDNADPISDYKIQIMAKKIINTDKAPAPIGPYNQAVMYGDILYTSGQIALNPESGELVMDTIENETMSPHFNCEEIISRRLLQTTREAHQK